jgi:hypothetical protein
VLHHAGSHRCALADIEGLVFLAEQQINPGRFRHLVYQRTVELRRQRRLPGDLARGDGDDFLAVLLLGDAQELPNRVGVAGGAVARAAGDVVARDQAVEVVARLGRIQPARQAHRAQRLGAEFVAGAAQLAAQEAVVEARVVGDEDAPLQALEQLRRDVVEARRGGDHLVGDAGEHLDGAGDRAAGIDQRRPLGDAAGSLDGEHRDFGDAVARRVGAGGLQVDDRQRRVQQAHHCGLMLPALMTSPHFFASPRMRSTNSPGVLPTGSAPTAAKRSSTSGEPRPATTSRWMRATASGGVPAGANMPNQV